MLEVSARQWGFRFTPLTISQPQIYPRNLAKRPFASINPYRPQGSYPLS